jgi:hypothetical protein
MKVPLHITIEARYLQGGKKNGPRGLSRDPKEVGDVVIASEASLSSFLLFLDCHGANAPRNDGVLRYKDSTRF